MANHKTQEEQILALLQRNLSRQRSKNDPAWSMLRNVAMFGDGANIIMDAIGRLQYYTEIAEIKTRILPPESLAIIERDWAPSHVAVTDELSPVSSADNLAVHCIATLRTVMWFTKDPVAGSGERSYRMTLRFNLDEPADAWPAATFFVVCYAAHDTASCARACGLISRLAQWRADVLDKTSHEYTKRCMQSDGRAVGIVVNTTPKSTLRDDDTLRATARRYSFTCIETTPESPTSVNHLCNRLLIAALRSVDAEWAPPIQPFVRNNDGKCHANGTRDDNHDRATGCALWPFGWPAFLCRSSARDETAALVPPPENGLDALRLTSSYFVRGGGGGGGVS